MEEEFALIQNLDPNSFEIQNYSTSDNNLISSVELDTEFSSSSDYIEYYIYDSNQTLVYPDNNPIPLTNFSVLKGDIYVSPSEDLTYFGFNEGSWIISYNFYRKRLYSDIQNKYFIKEISSDRTEIKLDSNIISNNDIISSINEFIKYRKDSDYFVDFFLNFGENQQVIANNIKLDNTTVDDPLVLIKLYDPLPSNFDIKDELWIVEKISDSLSFKVTFPFNIESSTFQNKIQGPNFNLNIKNETGASGLYQSYNTLIQSNYTSSTSQLKRLLKDKQIDININYEDYNEFVHFSSAQTRLENFAYKVGRIEHFTNEISTLANTIQSDTTKTSEYSSSKAIYERDIQDIINNFDGYDYFLYYNSGSQYSWPKKTSKIPYELYSTGSTEALTWLGSANPSSLYYGGQAISASEYDENNSNRLLNTIPEYLRDDKDNDPYKLFVDMAGQYYDDIWIYTKDLTNKFNADNRLEYGISKDLVESALKDFGIKLYSNNFSNSNLLNSLLGITPSGSYFPFPEITGSLPTPTGYEYVNTQISSSNDPINLNGVNKRLYKRLYHNLPYLFKTKGTIAGIEALLSIYGIPDTVLRVNEFGGKDRNNSQDWDLQQRVFNYKFDTEGKYIISSSFTPNSNFGGESPKTVQFRFKTEGIPTILSQSLYELPNDSALVLEYTGSGMDSGSYSGSIPNEYNKYGTLKFVPDLNEPAISASLYLPFFDGGWWSVQTTVNHNDTASLFAANQINKNLGFNESSTISGFDSSHYYSANKVIFPSNENGFLISGKDYSLFSGSYQEIRYYNTIISSSKFIDYTMNPYSFEGNTINSAPNELIFRADLGTLLNTGSITSVHPKITGSSNFVTQSFASDSEFYISSSNFTINREHIYQDQIVGGIKNRITDKISTNSAILPEGDTLSSLRSIQQNSFISSSYTPSIDYLEVAFSPQDQINDDINAQMGYFNIGNYIGDPRHISQSSRSYPDLDTLRDAYFQKYIDSYNLVDFVRLMKFFDNSLFKMIKDFTPARTSLTSGVVVKQHILERNKQRPAQVFYQDLTYTGSIKPQSRNYNTGSGDVGAYEFNNGSSIYRFSGGTGGSFEKFNGLQFSPSASAYGLSNRFGITQSFIETKEGKLGREIELIYNQEEFYDGEFSGSNITIVTQSISPGCMPYHKSPDDPVRYYPLFFSDSADDIFFGTTTLEFWQDNRNEPLPGYAWFFISRNPNTGLDEVVKIKLAAQDYSGNEVRDYLIGVEFVQFIFPEGFKKYFIEGTVINSNSALLNVDTTQGDYLFVSSSNGGTENWSLRVSGNVSSSANPAVAGIDFNSQNYFHAQSNFQLQPIRYYNDVYDDALGLFDTGSINYLTSTLLNNEEAYDWGVYTIPRTSNVPWIISASIAYSASGGGEIIDPIFTNGIYHSGSSFTSNLGRSAYSLAAGLTGTVDVSASIALPPVQIDLDSSFFNNNISNFAFGDQLHPFRISYLFTTDTTPSNSTQYKVGFNNADISLATQMFISLYDNEGGNWYSDNTDLQKFNQASSWVIYNPNTDNSRITITGATTSGNIIQGDTGNLWMVKQFNAGNAVQFGTPFSNDDPIKVIPSTISDASGHPRMLQAGTASLDFNFDEFKVGGNPTPPTNRSLRNITALQGNTPKTPVGHTNPNFSANVHASDYASFSVVPNNLVPGVYEGTGQVVIDYNDLKNYIDDQNGELNDVKITVNYSISSDQHQPDNTGATGFLDEFTNGISVIHYDSDPSGTSAGQQAAIFGTNRAFTTSTNTENRNLNPSGRQLTLSNIQTKANQGKVLRIFIRFSGFGQTFHYWINSFTTKLSFRQSTSGLPNTTSPVSGVGTTSPTGATSGTTSTQVLTENICSISQGNSSNVNKLVFEGSVNLQELRGNVQQRIWITGSSHTPRQLITSSLYNEKVNLSPGQVITFPDSPINGINREEQYTEKRYSVTGSGAVTFQYTDAYTNTLVSKTLSDGEIIYVNVRGGGTEPIQTSGGTIVADLRETNVLYPTINTTGSMYFIETHITGVYTPNLSSNITLISNFIPAFDPVNPSLLIEQEVGSPESGYRFTGSLQIYKGNADNKSTLGVPVLSRDFIIPNSESIENIELSGSFISNFKYNDTFRVAIKANKNLGSYLDITEYTMSIFPSESKFASIVDDPTLYSTALYGGDVYGGSSAVLTPGYGKYSVPILTSTIVPNFYAGNILPFALAFDCQPLINNFNLQRQSTYLMDVDYTNTLGIFKPVNYDQIIQRKAFKATVPDSNYTQHSWTDIRYEGSKAQGEYINIWSPSDFGTYGQKPVIELRNAYFGYFNSFVDPYPMRNDVTRLNMSYLVDGQGNALPPSLQGVANDIVEKTFPIGKTTKLAIDINADKQDLEQINTEHGILTVGSYPVPILYTQTSSRGYSSQIPFSGSGRLSLYDNPGTGFTDYSFTVEGTSSGDDDSGRSVSLFLNPSLHYVSSSQYAEQAYFHPSSPQGISIPEGAIAFVSESFVGEGQDTSQMQYVDLQVSFPTTYIHSGDYHRKGNWKRKTKRREYTEFKVKLELQYSELNDAGTAYVTERIPFIANDVLLKVWKGATQFNAGSVIDDVVFIKAQSTNSGGGGRRSGGGPFSKRNRKNTKKAASRKTSEGIPLDGQKRLNMHVNEDALYAILNSRGLHGDGITGLEWIFKANSGDNTYKKDSYLRWKFTGDMMAGNNGQNTINPVAFPGPRFATKFSLLGSKTHLLNTENTASAPFWVFAEDLPPGAVDHTTELSRRYIYMSASLVNEAYGDNWSQGELPYKPGNYDVFPGGVEPEGTKIGPTFSSLKLEEQDEIRFANNEDFSYKIVKVWEPQENIMSDDIGRIKLQLDRELPQSTSLNKDFFLIRRNIPNANSVILDLEYPYSLATISSSYVETQERNGQLLKTPNALLGSVKRQPTGTANGIPRTGSYVNVPLVYSQSIGNTNFSSPDSGSGALATITLSGSGDGSNDSISYIEITEPGNGYKVGDILTTTERLLNPNSGSGATMLKLELSPLNIGQRTVLVQDNVPTEFTSPGIMFPEFPSVQIETSASILINNLISKGVINN